MKNGRFFVGLVGVAGVVAYLIWTGVSDTMVYYLTPTEFAERVESDPSFADLGVKVSGRVAEGSWVKKEGMLAHSFRVEDLEFSDRALERARSHLLDAAVTTDSRKFRQLGEFRALAHVLSIIVRYQRERRIGNEKFFKDYR